MLTTRPPKPLMMMITIIIIEERISAGRFGNKSPKIVNFHYHGFTVMYTGSRHKSIRLPATSYNAGETPNSTVRIQENPDKK